MTARTISWPWSRNRIVVGVGHGDQVVEMMMVVCPAMSRRSGASTRRAESASAGSGLIEQQDRRVTDRGGAMARR